MNLKAASKAYAVFRFVTGVNFFMHGTVRLPKMQEFSTHLVEMFTDTILPSGLVVAYAYAVPVIEAAVGLLLILGLFTEPALIVGGLLMATFVFGMAMLENWGTVGTQMIYAIVFYLLLRDINLNAFAVDTKFGTKQTDTD
ncbi:MAG: DoxX family protein [Verrucomicrobiota bacterium]